MKWFFALASAMVVTPHQKHFHMRHAHSVHHLRTLPQDQLHPGKLGYISGVIKSDICPVLRR